MGIVSNDGHVSDNFKQLAILGEDIPILDLSPFLSGTPGAATTTASVLRHALERTGFFYLVNHRIDLRLRDRMFALTAAFFDKPLSQKMPLKINQHGIGYVPRRGQFLRTSQYYTGTRKPDACEAFLLQRDWGPGSDNRENPWPSRIPLFQDTARKFFDATEDLAVRMLPLYSLALGLQPEYFDGLFEKFKALTVLRVSYMPPGKLGDDEFNVAPHTDGSFVTLLATSDHPGLEILSPSGRWIPMPLIPNSFIVNSGDLLTRWSNGRVRSTPHRVINRSGEKRYSVPLFVQPTANTIIDCLPTCHGPDNPPKERPIACADYLHWYMRENFALGEQNYET